jgi:hypothetical protein
MKTIILKNKSGKIQLAKGLPILLPVGTAAGANIHTHTPGT